MKKCPYCAEEIQDAAVVCKHCGRDLAATPPPVVTLPPPKPGSRIVRLILYAFFAFAGLVALSAIFSSSPAKPAAAKQTMNVKVGWNATAVEVTNVSATAGVEMIVYINGTPPFTYKAVTTVPEPGKSVRVSLRDFVTKDGDRFNPLAKAVTVAWVGGGGYDYQSFGK